MKQLVWEPVCLHNTDTNTRMTDRKITTEKTNWSVKHDTGKHSVGRFFLRLQPYNLFLLYENLVSSSVVNIKAWRTRGGRCWSWIKAPPCCWTLDHLTFYPAWQSYRERPGSDGRKKLNEAKHAHSGTLSQQMTSCTHEFRRFWNLIFWPKREIAIVYSTTIAINHHCHYHYYFTDDKSNHCNSSSSSSSSLSWCSLPSLTSSSESNNCNSLGGSIASADPQILDIHINIIIIIVIIIVTIIMFINLH